jgi:hypothetical protein
MIVERVWAMVLAAAMFFIIATEWTPHSSARVQPSLVLPPHTTTVIDDRQEALPIRADDWPQPRVDLNGNEVDDAVSDYRVDERGEMYERHAPDTALLHLSAPEL